MKDYIVEFIKDELIKANGNIAQALEEVQYAEENDLVDENIEEIKEEMIIEGLTTLKSLLETLEDAGV